MRVYNFRYMNGVLVNTCLVGNRSNKTNGKVDAYDEFKHKVQKPMCRKQNKQVFHR